MANTNLDIIIQAQDKTDAAFGSASSGLSKFQSKIDDMQPAFKKMATIGTVAFSAIAVGAVSMVNAYADAEAETTVAIKSIENSLASLSKNALDEATEGATSVAGAMKFMKKQMDTAGASAVKLGFDDESAVTSFSKMFAVSKDVAKANKDVALAMDLARFKGISLEEATQKIMMVHAGATKELKALGIAVDENATAQQNLDSIYKQVSGTAEAYATTTKGQMEILKVSMGNLKESIGASLAPAFQKLVEAVTPLVQKFATWAEQNPDLLAKIVMVAGAIAGLVAVMGFLGMALPAIIAGFGLLSGPVGLIALAIGVVVAGFIAFKDQIGGIMAFLEDTGVLDYFRQIWDNISNTFQTTLLPAFQKLWDSLVKLKPFFEIIGQIVGGVLLVAIMALAKALEIIIVLFSNLLAVATKVATFMVEVFVKAFDVVRDAVTWLIDKFTILIQKIKDVIATAKEIGGNVLGAIGGAIGKIFKVNDAVVAPGGNVISTHPDDYIIATKDPSSLGGAGGLTININGGTYLDENVAAKIGDMLINTLNLNMRGS